MKTIVYGSYLVYYTDDKDRFIKCNKIDRGDTQGFRFIPDYVKHLETQLKQKEAELAEAREELESYKYDNQVLVDTISDCLNKISSRECFDVLTQVVEHYDQLKEKGE